MLQVLNGFESEIKEVKEAEVEKGSELRRMEGTVKLFQDREVGSRFPLFACIRQRYILESKKKKERRNWVQHLDALSCREATLSQKSRGSSFPKTTHSNPKLPLLLNIPPLIFVDYPDVLIFLSDRDE